jgi:NADP-dependent 3-hydroxy acid dehydrogenase YdfG
MSSILVAGASRGIGEAVARTLAPDHQVLMLARTESALAAIGKEIGAEWIGADATDSAQVERAADWCREQVGDTPDVLINCAGVFGLSAIAEADVSEVRAALEANVVGPFLLMRAVLPRMLERGSGLIINLGSVAGRKAFPGNGAYSASKFGLRGLHEVLLEELRGTGVRATLIEPGAVDTPLWDPIDPDNQPGLPPRAAMLKADDVSRVIAAVVNQPQHVQIPFVPVERA